MQTQCNKKIMINVRKIFIIYRPGARGIRRNISRSHEHFCIFFFQEVYIFFFVRVLLFRHCPYSYAKRVLPTRHAWAWDAIISHGGLRNHEFDWNTVKITLSRGTNAVFSFDNLNLRYNIINNVHVLRCAFCQTCNYCSKLFARNYCSLHAFLIFSSNFPRFFKTKIFCMSRISRSKLKFVEI